VIRQDVFVAELREEDLGFLLHLWHLPEVMAYADELPGLRGWTRSDDLATAWRAYQQKRSALGHVYVQFILRLADGTAMGESFFAPLSEGYTFGKWQKPDGVLSLMGDIKLHPTYWGRGLATEAMGQVVTQLFERTSCSLLVVPPHRKNPAAERVYEKAGFELYTGMRSWRNHKIMTLNRER
jgi:RimJ/RimL family protein N-acetyltransferase